MKTILLLFSLMTAQIAVAGTFEILVKPSKDLDCYTVNSSFDPGNIHSRAKLIVHHVPDSVVFTGETVLWAENVGPDCREFDSLRKEKSLKVTLEVDAIDMVNESNGKHYIYEQLRAVIASRPAFIFWGGGNDGNF